MCWWVVGRFGVAQGRVLIQAVMHMFLTSGLGAKGLCHDSIYPPVRFDDSARGVGSRCVGVSVRPCVGMHLAHGVCTAHLICPLWVTGWERHCVPLHMRARRLAGRPCMPVRTGPPCARMWAHKHTHTYAHAHMHPYANVHTQTRVHTHTHKYELGPPYQAPLAGGKHGTAPTC